ncbi:sensor domain-containing diguanylate cyclase [Pseudoalteromonas sp. L1]|uniref:sensor domain-containing diguanylate cyclase n=1 Tax=Pseudoalteromonas sp. L1 TaxID=195716 RepID=UPI001F2B837C|nr:sensor domain-containing diguanylate cyclase [Pseudoalteromonas sp. L1]
MLNSLRTGLNLHRLILLLAFSATLITFLNSYYSSYQVQKQQLINETLNNHKAYAAKLVSATDNFLLAAQQQLAYVGKILEADFNNQELINAETERLRLQTNSFNSTIIVNKKGNILGVSPASLNLQNLKVDSFGTKAALSYRRPMISEPYISMAGNLLIFMSQPLFDKTGEFIGYVGGTLYLKRASILNELLQVHYYQDGSYLYVVDENNRLLYHPNKHRIGEQVFDNKVIESVLSGHAGTQVVKNSQGIEMLAGYAPLSVAPWGVVTQRPLQSTLAPLDNLMWQVFLRTAPIGLFTFILIWVLARLISQPLKQLAETASTLDRPTTSQELKQLRSWYYESNELRNAMLKGVGLLQSKIGLLRQEAQTDPLTCLHNRRSLDIRLSQLMAQRCPFAVLAIDIDHFKRVNDEFGHDIGDLVLQSLAKLLVDATREGDVVARTGGEEFIVIMPKVTAKRAYQLAERLRMQVSEYYIEPVGCINVSIGISGWPLEQLSIEDVMKLADQALYKAKKTGRNRCVLDATFCQDLPLVSEVPVLE